MMGTMGKHAGPKTLLSAPCGALSRYFSGADDEIRTRDPHLGKKKAMEPVQPIQVVRLAGFRAPFIRSSPHSFLHSEPPRIAR
jgi:hypothetical protein